MFTIFYSQVSPIEYGHVLLIPHVLDCLPQKIDHDSFLLALHMAKEAADPFFRLGYNSLGAFATINHLHFQVINLYHILFPSSLCHFCYAQYSCLSLNDGLNFLLALGILLDGTIPS